jgi:hypothetical protein
MVEPDTLVVEVAYARPDKQVVVPVTVPAGATLEQAVRQSRILERFPEIDLATAKVGIFSKPSPLSRVLMAGDRVEIYRPLLADPRQVRKQRAAGDGKKNRRGAAGAATAAADPPARSG